MRSILNKVLWLSVGVVPFLSAIADTPETGSTEKKKEQDASGGGANAIKRLMATAQVNDGEQDSKLTNKVMEFFCKAIDAALKNNKDLRKLRAEVLKGLGNNALARAQFLPDVNVSAGYDFSTTYNTSHINYEEAKDPDKDPRPIKGVKGPQTEAQSGKLHMGLGLQQNLFKSFGSVAGYKAATNENKAAFESYKAEEGGIILKVFDALLQVISGKIAVDVNTVNVNMHKELLNATVEKMKVGAIERSEVAYAQAKYASSQCKLEAARADLEDALSNFELWTGMSAATILAVHPDFEKLLAQTLEERKRIAEKYNHKVLAGNYMAIAKKAAVKKASAELGLSVDLQLGASLSKSEAIHRKRNDGTEKYLRDSDKTDYPTDFSAGVSIRLPLDINGTRRTGWEGARHEYVKTTIGGAQTLGTVMSNVETWSGWLEHKKAIVEARKKQVKACQIALQGSLQELAVGAKVYIQTIKAQSDLQEAQVDLARARQDLAHTQLMLLNEMGMLNSDVFGSQGFAFDPIEMYKPKVVAQKVQCKHTCKKAVATKAVAPKKQTCPAKKQNTTKTTVKTTTVAKVPVVAVKA